MTPEGYHLSDINCLCRRTQTAACVMPITFQARSTGIKNRLSTESGLGGYKSSSDLQNNVSIGPTVPEDVEWYLDMLGYEETRSLTGSLGAALKCVGPEPMLGVSRQDIQRTIRHWLVNQHWVRWRCLGNTQRQTRELISRPWLGAKVRFLSFNRAKSRAVTGLLTGHNTLMRYLHLMGLSDSPLCRRCGAEDETSAHILCECEASALLRRVYLGSFLEPQDIKSISLGAIWNFSKVAGLPWIDRGHKGLVK